MNYRTAVFGLLLSLVASVDGAERMELKGIALGSSESTVQARFPWVKCEPATELEWGDRVCISLNYDESIDLDNRQEMSKRLYCHEKRRDWLECLREGLPSPRNEGSTIADVPADISFYFFGDVLHMITARIDSDRFDEVAKALRQKYGAPASDRGTVQNRFGASFNNDVQLWTRGNDWLRAERYDDNLKRSAIIYRSAAGDLEHGKRVKMKAKKGSRDL